MEVYVIDYRRLLSEDETSMFPVNSATLALMRATRDSIAVVKISNKLPPYLQSEAGTHFPLR